MDNNQNAQGHQLQIDIPDDVVQGVYSNFAVISHSSSEFVVDFAQIAPGVQKASVRSRVILAPEHVKRLIQALQENVVRYESEFGRIRIPNQPAGPVSPFGMGNKGEA